MAKKFCVHSANAWCRCNSEVGEDAQWQGSFVRTVQMRGADATVKWARMCSGEEVLCAWCRCVVQMQRQSGRGCAVAKKFCAHSANAWCRCNGEVGKDALWQGSFVRMMQMCGADAAAKYARTPRGLSDSWGIAFGPICNSGHARMCGSNATSVDMRGCVAVQKICEGEARCRVAPCHNE